jgi:hypothetical protein
MQQPIRDICILIVVLVILYVFLHALGLAD